MEEGKIISALWYDDYQLKLEIFDSFNLLIFVKLSCKIADKLEHCGIISKSNRTLYEYGLRQMFATILNILTMLLIGFIMGLAVPAMVYTIVYIPLRVYAGRLSCFYTAAMLGIFCDNVMDCTVYRKIHAPNVFLGDYNIVVDSLHRCFFAVAGRRSK